MSEPTTEAPKVVTETWKRRATQVEAVFDEEKDGVEVIRPDGSTEQMSLDSFAEQYEKVEEFRYPGHLNVVDNLGGHFNGCKFVTLSASTPDLLADAVNAWAEEYRGALIVQHQVTFVNGLYVMTILAHWVTTQEERDQVRKWAQKAEELRREENSAKAIERRDAFKEARKREDERRAKLAEKKKEEEQMANLGRYCIKNHKKDKKK